MDSQVKDIDAQIEKLQALKLSINDTINSPSKVKKLKEARTSFNLKTPKGTKDWIGSDMVLREKMFKTILDVFRSHGAVALDTPVFELKEILSGKYGEDSKLIYDLQDQGGELCSLRYDLTVPFARVLAMNPNLQTIKRYHLAKVYRRDQPALKKGRMREFFQCDFDIAGAYDAMLPDAEIVRIIDETLSALDIGKFTLKINHRKILDGIFQICGVPDEKIRTISSAVDKLDKTPWEEVKREMVEEKGLSADVAEKIWSYVQHKGAQDLIEWLSNDTRIQQNSVATEGLNDMKLLFEYASHLDCTSNLSFDLSLARGLDYYTGVIFEATTEASIAPAAQQSGGAPAYVSEKTKDPDADRSEDDTLGVGSICGGGRYDELVGMFAANKRGRIPCVGFSVGVERIFSILKSRQGSDIARGSETEVFVMAFGSGFVAERLAICKDLWSAGLRAEFLYKCKPKPKAQFDASERSFARVGVIIGQEEVDSNQVRVKLLGTGDENNKGELVGRSDMVGAIRKVLA